MKELAAGPWLQALLIGGGLGLVLVIILAVWLHGRDEDRSRSDGCYNGFLWWLWFDFIDSLFELFN